MSGESPIRTEFPFGVHVPVRWGDLDALGHVNHATTLVYFETVRMALFRASELDAVTDEGRLGPALVNVNCNYRKQIRDGRLLDVRVRVGRVGRTSFTLEYGAWDIESDELVADATTVVVWVDYQAERSAPVPESLIARMSSAVS